MAVKEQRPAVKRMKKGSSFFGYTDTSWNAGRRRRGGRGQCGTTSDFLLATRYANGLHVGGCTHRAVVPGLPFPCTPGRGKTGDPSPEGRELSGRLWKRKETGTKDEKSTKRTLT